MLEDVGEPNQDRKRNAAPFEGVAQLLEIDAPARLLCRVNEKMAVLADGKIAFAPTADIVKLRCIGGGPTIRGLMHLSGYSDFGVQRRCSLSAVVGEKRCKVGGSYQLN